MPYFQPHNQYKIMHSEMKVYTDKKMNRLWKWCNSNFLGLKQDAGTNIMSDFH